MTTTPAPVADPYGDLDAALDWAKRSSLAIRGAKKADSATLADVEAVVIDLTRDLNDEKVAHELTKTLLGAALKRVKELEGAPAVERISFGIGCNEKPTGAASPLPFSAAVLEKEAGRVFAFMREYFTFPTTGVHTSAIAWCKAKLAAGRNPVVSFKLPYSWKDVAAGKLNTVIDATMDQLADLAAQYPGQRVYVAVHHEPNNGDGTFADFKAMTLALIPIIRRPGQIEFWVNYTGWANLQPGDPWELKNAFIEGVDGYAFDPYLSLGDTNGTTKLTNMVTGYFEKFAAWAKEHNVQWGIWETGLTEPAAKSTLPGVKTWITDMCAACERLGATMWIYWNNKVAPSTAKPVTNDWRITVTAPANKRAQVVAALKLWGRDAKDGSVGTAAAKKALVDA